MADANRVVVELIGNTSNLDAAVASGARSVDRAMATIAASASRAENQVKSSAGAIGFATRDLGFQIGDIGQQLSGGQSPFLILAQQAPQVVDAISLISASGATLGQVLKGIALPGFLAVASVIATQLIPALFGGASASDEHKRATKELKDAIDQLNQATGAAARTEQQRIGILVAASRAEYSAAIAARERTKALLEQAIANERVANSPTVGGGIAGTQSVIQGQASARVAELRAELDKTSKAAETTKKRLDSAFQGAVASSIQQRVADETDKSAAANRRLEATLIRLRQQNIAGKLSDDDLAAATRRAYVERDNVTKAAERERAAKREANKETREAAKAEREHEQAMKALQATYEGLLSALDPASAALDTYRKQLTDIDKLVRAGRFTPDQADTLRGEALDRFLDADEQAGKKAIADDRARAFGDDPAFSAKAPDKVESTGAEALKNRFQVEDAVYRKQQDNVRSLADLYEQAFTGGSKNIGEALKRELVSAAAAYLAKMTIAKAGSLFAGGGALSGIGSFLGLGGRASGGYVAPNSLTRVNEQGGGVELLRMGSQGGTVIPLGSQRAAQSGGNVTVQQTINVDGRNSVTPGDFAAQIVTVANRYADQASASAQGRAIAASPGAVRRQQQLGST